jgi:hypothetical protein
MASELRGRRLRRPILKLTVIYRDRFNARFPLRWAFILLVVIHDHLGTPLPRLPFFLLDGYRVSPTALHGPLRAFAHIGVVPFAALPTWPAISTPKAQAILGTLRKFQRVLSAPKLRGRTEYCPSDGVTPM